MRSITRLVAIAALAAATELCGPVAAGAWGLKGHELIGLGAVAHLPAELPAFVRTDSARRTIVYLQSEEDRLKIGEADEAAWTREWTTDHYLDVDDAGSIGGVISLNALPPTRDAYIKVLAGAAKPVDAYNLGFLPYAILEGYEQVRSDFALWRIAINTRRNSRGAAFHQADAEVAEREALTIHDIGIFSHFVGDASQPLHVTVHYNGWGKYPNPRGFTQSRRTHKQYEDSWVDRYLTAAAVIPLVGAPRELRRIPLSDIEAYLGETDAQVIPFYEREQRGAFRMTDGSSDAHREAVEFTAARLAAASQMLDSLILTAWRTSAGMRPQD